MPSVEHPIISQSADAQRAGEETHTRNVSNVGSMLCRKIRTFGQIFSPYFFPLSAMSKRWGLSLWQDLQVQRMCGPLPTHNLWKQSNVQASKTQGNLCLPSRLTRQPLCFLHGGWLSISWGLLWQWEVWLSKPLIGQEGMCEALYHPLLCPRGTLWGKEPQGDLHLQLPITRRWLHLMFRT
jgi:hypothetical protein